MKKLKTNDFFKPVSEMKSLEEFLIYFLPAENNKQDVIYLTCRYEWENSLTSRKVDGYQTRESMKQLLKELWEKKDLAWDKMIEAFKGTTFEMKNFPDRYKIGDQGKSLVKNHLKNDRSREAQQPLF